MPLVIDVSVMASWCFPDERSDAGEAILRRLTAGKENAHVPGIWWFEMHNVLLQGERRRRCTLEQAEQFVGFLSDLPISIKPNPQPRAILNLSRRHGLTFYDAAYLELAQRERIALATFDGHMARAAIAEGVPLIGD